MELKSGYKQTEVGLIPEDWEVKPFQSLAKIERGKFTARPRNDPKYYGGDIPFIQTGDVANSSGEITTFSQTLNHEGLKVSKLFPQGTLFFTIAANIGDVGFAAFDTACPDSLVAITPKKRIDKRWLAHELTRRKPSFGKLATQNAQLNINLEKLRPYLLPVPPTKAEQEAIAQALSDADVLIESLRLLVAKKRQIKQGAMQELLTGKKRLPGFSGEWKVKRLGQIVSLIPSGAYGDEKPRVGLLPRSVATTAHIDENDMWNRKEMSIRYFSPEQIRQYSPIFGDLIIVKSSGSAEKIQSGKVGFIDKERAGKFLFSNFLMLLRPTGVVPTFLYYYLCSYSVKKFLPMLVEASTYPNIRIDQYLNLEIPFPDTDEQTAIASTLSDMDAEIVTLEEWRGKARQLKQGMMEELLTGKIRLT